uniref:Noelin domain-containing protein n=1 Tax=Hippocampus comes TaxID=109280 RepID=A0A3Q2YGF8_HIPCM
MMMEREFPFSLSHTQTQVGPAERDGWQVFSSAQDSGGGCVCTVLTPLNGACSRDARSKQVRHLLDKVQNMSRSIEDLERRSRQDIGVVEKMEVELRGLENKFKEVEAGHESSRARHYQVSQVFDALVHI